MSTHNAQVTLRGRGSRITAHYIDDQILKAIKKMDGREALYEGNKFSNVVNLAIHSKRVLNGFCIYQNDDFKCNVVIDNIECKIDEIGILEDGCDFSECFSGSPDSTLAAPLELSEPLEFDSNIESNYFFIIEVEEFTLGELVASFSSKNKIAVDEIKLGLIDLDVDSELSEVTYQIGLTGDSETSIKYVIHNGVHHELDLAIENGYASKFYLVKRNESGNWSQVLLEN